MNKLSKLTTFTFSLLVSSLSLAENATEYGVIAYNCKDNKASYLLAFDSNEGRKGWGAFGRAPHKGEISFDTAIKSFDEGTNCAYSYFVEEQMIVNTPQISPRFTAYVSQVPFKKPAEIAEKRECENLGLADWVWVSEESLLKALDSDDKEPKLISNQSKEVHLWSGAKDYFKLMAEKWDLKEKNICEVKYSVPLP